MELSSFDVPAGESSVRRARDAYLAENGFTLAAYEEPWTKASFFSLEFAVPNTERHRWAIKLHDLHHVATGFGTDLAGEGEISAWELRAGLKGLGLYVGAIVMSGVALGALVAPRRTWRAWTAARGARALWTRGASADDLLPMTVAELRDRVGVPCGGLAREPRKLHKNAPRIAPAPMATAF